jgi:enoyl-CoA hydratase
MAEASKPADTGADHELTWHEDCAVFRIRRPRSLNALTKGVLEALSACLDEVEARGVRALVIVGEGEKAFCAGTDLAELTTLTDEARHAKTGYARRLLVRLHRSKVVSVAAVNGLAFGGGMELALACTFRIAAPHATFALPEVKLGVFPVYGGTQFLPAVVGQARAVDLMITGRTVDCAEALAMGLVSRVAVPGGVPAVAGAAQSVLAAQAALAATGAPPARMGGEELVAQAIALARTVTCWSGVAVDAIRASVQAAGPVVTDEGLAAEEAQSQRVMASEDGKEGVRAFVEKRPPVFRNR